MTDNTPEALVADWLNPRTEHKCWADPRLPEPWDFTAPLVHIQSGPGAEIALTLDAVILDVDVYAARADNAGNVANRVRAELQLRLPGHTWESGLTVSAVRVETLPFWSPDPKVFKRSASYRVYFHGLLES
ncbi:hypothetical protein [Micromonospora tulbaghiae]|uniref:hypothetical protein n=1 Tax=Micromonospora tulbaghiae TaxID=479978 RepID=UPI0033C1255A